MRNLSLDIQQALIGGDRAPNNFIALKDVVSNICEFAGWDYGEVWVPDKEGTILELHSTFYITAHKSKTEVLALEQFRACSEGFSFPPATGLPGRVWSSKQAEWLSDASSESERVFLRHKIAKGFGVKTGFGVPILSNDRVLAVVVFFMLDICKEDKQLTELIATILMQIGGNLESLLKKD
jgi:hypothetical protein